MHINCHSYFSFRYGTMSPKELLQEAQQKGLSSLALTDVNNTSGILEFFRLADAYGIKPVAGIDFRNGTEQKFIGIAKNMDGYRELNDFLSAHLREQKKFDNRTPAFENAIIIYPVSPAAPLREEERKSYLPYLSLRENEYVGVKPSDLFKLNFRDWKKYLDKLVILAPVTFRNKIDFNTHRLLRAIDNSTLLSKLSAGEQAQPDEIMLTEDELRFVYKEYPQMERRTKQLLEQCEINFEFGKNKNLKYFTGSEEEDAKKLRQLCKENLSYRYPNKNEEIETRFDKEINAISSQGFASYFLINWDIVRYAQSKNYFYVGRGSGANSMVAYLLKITDVDPIDLDLYFERFLNPSRTSPPDFDIDFSSDERNDVIDYIFHHSPYGKKYKNHIALLATYSTFQWDATIRELGKVFGLPKAEIDSFFDGKTKTDHISRLILNYGKRLIDLPNHLSIHAGGILISDRSIHNYTATSFPPKSFPLAQFSMLEAEDVGLFKFDILAQRGLGKVRDAVDIIKRNRNEKIDIHAVEKFKQDDKVRENLQSADLMGCFYVESPAMRMLLTKLEAKTYLDLVAASSIIRPGVASSGMMREYILRFKGEKPTYETPEPIYKILHDTYGVMVYQEDVIKVACAFAGLTYGEADMLRRGMSGKYRGRAEFKTVEQRFFDNCQAKGHHYTTVKEVWRQIESFAGYAFSKGHSASYAVESYQCMYLKTYYPLEYMVAVINNGGGFYGVEYYIHEARMCGGNVHAPDINFSFYQTSIYDKDIYLGLNLLHEFEKNMALAILEERICNGKFQSLADFMKRVDIAVEQLRILIRINAFRFTGRTKQQLLWDMHTVIGSKKKTDARKEIFEVEPRQYQLPDLYYTGIDNAWDEMELLGFPLRSPFDMLPEVPANAPGDPGALNPLPVIERSSELKDYLGKVISIKGYFVTRKNTQTRKGQAMAFGTFLDREGKWIDTTHFPDVIRQFPFSGKGCYMITGKVVVEFDFYSLDVTAMHRLDYIQRFSVTKEKEHEIK